MKHRAAVALAAVILAQTAIASNDVFEQGLKALASKDHETALKLMEQALSGDPDNVRFASEYRQAVVSRAKALHPKEGQPQDFERSVKFFERLVGEHPNSANAYLNYGFAIVDKMPAAGAITQVILANTALTQFTKSIELKPSWIAYYTRGNSYLYWPKIFNRAPLGIADLEQALKIQKAGPKRGYYVRAYISLGDGYWKIDDLDKARSIWKEGLQQFPDNADLKQRLAKEGDELKAVIDDSLDPNKRVDTNLRELWMQP